MSGNTPLDEYFPPRGPCAFCGHKDARHRLWDALMDRVAAGDSAESVAEDYGISMKAMNLVLKLRPYKRKRK